MTMFKQGAKSRLATQKKGFTLTEIAIVLGIIGLILGAIWVAASSVYANQKLSKANTELLAAAQGIRSLYAGQYQFDTAEGTDDTAMIIQANIFPTDALNNGNPNSATSVNAPWSGSTIHIFGSTQTTVGDSFEVMFVSVPQSACVNLLSTAASMSRDQSMLYAGAEASTGKYMKAAALKIVNPNIAGYPGPLSVNTINGLCLGTTSDAAFIFTMKG